MTDAKRFGRRGQPTAAEPHHYRACGLDDVYLHSGFETKETEYGPVVSVQDVPGLLFAIGMSLVESAKPLSAREFRFLRKQMDMTQETLAERLRVDVQTVARYEKDQTSIPGPTDTVLRMMYVFHVCPKGKRVELFEHMLELLEDARAQAASAMDKEFSFSPNEGWREGMTLQ